jgi:hypothetical protein
MALMWKLDRRERGEESVNCLRHKRNPHHPASKHEETNFLTKVSQILQHWRPQTKLFHHTLGTIRQQRRPPHTIHIVTKVAQWWGITESRILGRRRRGEKKKKTTKLAQTVQARTQRSFRSLYSFGPQLCTAFIPTHGREPAARQLRSQPTSSKNLLHKLVCLSQTVDVSPLVKIQSRCNAVRHVHKFSLRFRGKNGSIPLTEISDLLFSVNHRPLGLCECRSPIEMDGMDHVIGFNNPKQLLVVLNWT